MIQTLQLRHVPASDQAPEAWFLPGDSAEGWLEELARCGMASMDTRLFIVPRSVESRACAGLLVVPARPNSLAQRPAGIPCRRIAGRLFVPADAVLYPPVTDGEVRRLCALAVSFLHPVFGLSGFDEESILRASDLLQMPPETPTNWNLARPGPPPLRELSGIVLLQPPSLEDVFGDAPGQIGVEPLVDLPPAPGEPKEGAAARTANELSRAALEIVSHALRAVPHTAAHRTWVNDLEDWVHRHLGRLAGQLEHLRNKEIHRLLHLLDSDPETGLRHAIPMNQFAHRGVAPPTARLGKHSLDFDPRRLGGRPADIWNVPGDLQEVLRRRYREMADREMQLGRHRRAAYIYAELLGDLVSAASTLKRGGLFREAALLYEEHLRNPAEAARCLAEAGLLAEAIERYEKLGFWLEVADLQERAGNQAAAQSALRRVVDERLGQGDILGAARLVEDRLRAPDEALEMLWRAWPASAQAANCLGAAFRLLARLGRHEAAMERLRTFNRAPPPDSVVLPLAEVLGGVAREFPRESVRHRAADLSRVLISRRLCQKALAANDAGRLLEQLVRLAPQDRLLIRDANRHLAERRRTEFRPPPIIPPPSAGKTPIPLRRFDLPRQIQWLELRRERLWFYALGVTPKRLTVLRGVWNGNFQSLSWQCTAEEVRHGLVFEPTAELGHALALRTAGPPLPVKRFPAADLFFSQECLAGTPSWLPSEGFPFAFGEGAVWSMHVAAGSTILSCFDQVHGQLLRTIDVTAALLSDAERTEHSRLCLAASRNGVAVAMGNRLVIARGEELTRVELPGQAMGLVATYPNTREGVAVMLHSGACMYWLGSTSCIELDKDLVAPIGAFVPGGPLVLVSDRQALLLDVDSRGVKTVSRLSLTGQRVVGVSSTNEPGEFALLGERGEMTIYRVPR